MAGSEAFINEERNGVTIVYCMQQWLLDPELAERLTKHLCKTLDEGTDRLLINLEGVTRLSSVFIRSFIATGKKVKAARTTMAFCNVSPVVAEVFSLTGLNTLYTIYRTEMEALGALED